MTTQTIALLSERIKNLQHTVFTELLALQGDLNQLLRDAEGVTTTHGGLNHGALGTNPAKAPAVDAKAEEGERRATHRRDPELLRWYKILNDALLSWPAITKYHRTTYMVYYYRGSAIGAIYLIKRKSLVRTFTKGNMKDVRRIVGASVKIEDLAGQKHQGVGDLKIEWQPRNHDVQEAIQVFRHAYEAVGVSSGGG